jgi:hypothetical protein
MNFFNKTVPTIYRAPDGGQSADAIIDEDGQASSSSSESKSKKMSVDERTRQKLSGSTDSQAGDESGEGNAASNDKSTPDTDDSSKESSKEGSGDKKKTSNSPPSDAPDEVDKGSSKGSQETSSDDSKEGDKSFYTPEEYKSQNDLSIDVPHTNEFNTRSDAEFAAVNKASMIKKQLKEFSDDGIDRGAIQLPDILEGDIDNINNMEDMARISSVDDDDLKKFLWQSDNFRHRLDDKSERVRGNRQSQQTSQEFEQLEKSLYDGLQDVLGKDMIDNQSEEVLRKINTDKQEGQQWLAGKIDERIENELSQDIKAIDEFIESDYAGLMEQTEFARELDKRRDSLEQSKKDLESTYQNVLDDYTKAFDMAPKVNDSKEATDAQMVQEAWDAIDTWQQDQAGYSNLLDDNPASKEELKAFVTTAMRNKEKFNNLQHPSDVNQAERWWYDEFKPSIRTKQNQKDAQKQATDDTSEDGSEDGSGGDDISSPDKKAQQNMRNYEEEDVYEMSNRRMDRLEEKTRQRINSN